MDNFFQQPPTFTNQFTSDKLLQKYLVWKFPKSILSEIEPELETFGDRVIQEVLLLGKDAERNIPQHLPYNAWGKKIDHIIVSSSWKKLQNISAEEGLIAIGYEKKQQEFSRIYQFAKLYLFHASSAFFTCPLAMTDGAAKVLETHETFDNKQVFEHLISRTPENFWTSGQWMTEKSGGSDVSGTQTKAIEKGVNINFFGTKWFTSATTSEIALTLAKINDSEKLSLFLVKLRNEQNELQNICIHRLKDKLGTKALPTAELSLQGTPAVLIGKENCGVKQIASMLNITRLYNSVTALSDMRRCFVLALDYAKKRKSFGKYLIEHPLHAEIICQLHMSYVTCFHLVFYTVELLGKNETNLATMEENRALRILTPIVKLYTAKQAISVASETLECFGGAGYIEDTNLPQFLRNAQVYSIWEGTANILSLDLLRAIAKEDAFSALCQIIHQKLDYIKTPQLSLYIIKTKKSLAEITEFFQNSGEDIEMSARDIAYSIAKVFISTLLIEYCEHQKNRDSATFLILEKWFSQHFIFLDTKKNYAKTLKSMEL